MDAAARQLIAYASYHRDPRNLATHFIGIPLIVFGVAAVLVALPMEPLMHWLPMRTAWLILVPISLWYLRLGRPGVTIPTIAAFAIIVAIAQEFGDAVAAPMCLDVGIASFVIGWIAQAIGHVFEGRKPAFFDDLRGLLVGPMFLVAEALIAAGPQRALRDAIEAEAGPMQRNPAHAIRR